MKKKIQVIDADYRIEDGEVTIRCFGKSAEGENVLFLDEDFLPYLYAVPEKNTDLNKLEQRITESEFEEEGEEIPVRKVEQKKLKDGNIEKEVLKVYSSIPAKIPKLKNQLWDMEEISECREFDIPFYKRYLIDNGIKPAEWIEVKGEALEPEEIDIKLKLESLDTDIQLEKDQEWETLAFDLEVYQDNIIMASVYSDNFRKVFTTEEIDREFVETVESEREIIAKLIGTVRERDIDILLGYNTDEYDFDILRERSDEYGLELSMGREGERMKFNRRGRFSGARLKGRMHLDLYPFISHVLSPGLDSETLDLDSVAEEMLDENKDDLSWEEMKASWRDKEDLDKFADYALKDSELAYKLGKEIGPQILELSRITGLIPFDACRLTYGQLTENYLIREAYERDMIARNRPSRDKRRNRRRQGAYSGGFVYTPEPGLYENIAVFDFKSLPPDEEVYLKDPEGCFVKEKIGELEQKIQNPLDWETLSFNTDTMQVEWKRLRKVVSHQNNFEYLYSFETETGKSIKLTPNHSVYTLNEEGKPCVRDANELEKGDNLIAPKKFAVEETSSLDLLRLLKSSEAQNEKIRLFLPREIFPENERIEAWKQILRCVCEGKSLKEVRQNVERNPETVMRNIRRMDEKDLVEYKEGRISVKESGRKYFKLLKNLQKSKFNGSYYLYSSIEKIDPEWLTDEMWEKGTLKKKNAYWTRKMPLKWNPSKEMCWGMGLFIAGGWTDRKYARVHFSNTDEEILQKLEHLFEEFDPEIVEDEGDQEIRIGGGIFARIFSTLFGRTSEQKKISEEIFNLSRSQKKGLIEGMVAGDGSVSEKSFKYTTCSRELATGLQNILLSIGIYKTALRKSRENLYDLRVLTKPGEWKSYSGEREQHPLDLVPREYAEESLNQELKWGHRGPRIDSEKVFSNLKEKTPKLAFFEGDAGLEKIEKKEKIESDAKLYDLSVQGNQNFFAGEMPLLVHNSLYPTVMVAHNISPDTLNLEECEDRFELEEFDYDFCQDYQGFFPELVEELVEDRSLLKQKMSEYDEEASKYQELDNRQQAEKILANSVGPDTNLVLRDPEGKLCVLSVEKFYELIQSEEKIVNGSKCKEIEGWEALSVQDDEAVFKQVYAATRHNPGDTYKIRTKMGSVTVTGDHSIISMEGEASNRIRDSEFNGLEKVKGSKISEENVIAQVSDLELGSSSQEVVVPEVLKNCPENFYLYIPKSENLEKRDWYRRRVDLIEAVIEGRNSDEINSDSSFGDKILRKAINEGLVKKKQIIGHRGNTYECQVTEKGEKYKEFYNTFKEREKNSRHYLISLEDLDVLPPREMLENSFVANKSGRARNKVPATLKLTENFASLLGWFVAEGHVRKDGTEDTSYMELGIASNNPEQREEVQELFKSVFGYEASINGRQVTCCASTIARILSELCGNKADQKKVPKPIFNCQKHIRESFLDSYSLGDGDEDGRRFSTISKELQAGLSLLIKEEDCILHNSYDAGTYRVSRRTKTQGEKIVSGDLYGQKPVEVNESDKPGNVYDISVKDTEKFVTAEGLVLHNSFYGYLGYNGARWYSRECAEATTYLGREYIRDTIDLAEDEGFEIAYGDTDSVFMKGKNIREEMDSFLEKVNDDLPEFMKLEFEGFFERGFFTSTDSGEGAKKKYALIDEEGGMKITGFEQVRRDWSPIAKKTQKKVLREVLENDIDEAVEIAKRTIEELRGGKVPVEELRIYTTLNKKPENYDSTAPHVEAAKKAMKQGIDITPGSTISYVITRGGGSISQRARILEQADSYDADYYIENQVLPAVMRVLKVFGYTEGQLKGKGKQSGLGKFG